MTNGMMLKVAGLVLVSNFCLSGVLAKGAVRQDQSIRFQVNNDVALMTTPAHEFDYKATKVWLLSPVDEVVRFTVSQSLALDGEEVKFVESEVIQVSLLANRLTILPLDPPNVVSRYLMDQGNILAFDFEPVEGCEIKEGETCAPKAEIVHVTFYFTEEVLEGAKGDRGDTGIAGPVGAQGPSGVAGSVGPAGPRGADGASGANGVQGPAGPAGPVGPKGDKGEKGANGSQGPAGPQGPRGSQGPQGPAGICPKPCKPGDPKCGD